MTIAQLFSMLLDVGLGASALFLAQKLVVRVNDHEKRITVLERKAA